MRLLKGSWVLSPADNIPPVVSTALVPIVEHQASEVLSLGGGGGAGTEPGLEKVDRRSLI